MNRYATLSIEHDGLVEELEQAKEALYSAIGTSREADAQGAYARADAALSAWLDSDEGAEWASLEAGAAGKAA